MRDESTINNTTGRTPEDGSDARHLTAAELDGLLFPAAIPAQAGTARTQHLRSCAACAGELAGMRASIGLLRTAATGMARQQTALRGRGVAVTELPAVGRMRSVRGIPLAIAASLLGVAVLVPAVWHGGQRRAEAPAAAPARSVADDEALLRAIDEQLSASVPSALEPLANPAQSTLSSSRSGRSNPQPTSTTKD